MTHGGGYGARARLRWSETLPWVLALAAYYFLPEYMPFGARVLIFILFALSLDLILGYAGIITLGHAAFFGIGAYTAGILGARAGITDPLLQLAAAAIVSAAVGGATGAILLRRKGLTLLMLTLAVAAVAQEIANRAHGLTGGADGLTGITVAPILGLFRFDLFGRTGFLYCLAVLFVGWVIVRRVVYSPFGAALTGIRENAARMHAIGAPVEARMIQVYALSAGLAGMAGALLTQVNQIVGLNVLSFELSGELLVMLILGGVGRIYGAFVGPVVYLVAQDELARESPAFWYLGIGVLMVGVVMFARGGILGIVDKLMALVRRP